MSDSETSSPNSDKKRNVGNETPFVGLRAHGNGIKPALMSTSSCSKGMVLPLVLDTLKDRNAVFGFLFDVAVQRNYYDNMGLESVVTEEDYLDIYEKDSIVRRAARMAQCVLRLRTTTGKMAVFACFGTYNPPYHSNGLPFVDGLTEFKELLFLNTDPKWFAL